MVMPSATKSPKLVSVCFSPSPSEVHVAERESLLAHLVKSYVKGEYRPTSPVGKLTYTGL